MRRGFVFPGQGSQAVGMGRALAEEFGEARAVFGAVDDALDQKLSQLMWDGPESELTLTENAQPALMAVSMAVVTVLAENGVKLSENAAYVAGHSLGEYSALTASGALELEDAARLLKLRGQAMQRAVPVGVGAMAALLGLDFEAVVEVAEEAGQGEEICAAANDNAVGQVVVSGHAAAVARAIDLAKERGAKRAMELPVSAPFHCSLMQPAADEMQAALAETGWGLTHIFITHHHADHTDGLAALKSAYDATVLGPKIDSAVSHLYDTQLGDGDHFEFAGRRIDVLATPGHTLDMINFYSADDQIVCTGDTLFVLGCGRLFEGGGPALGLLR